MSRYSLLPQDPRANEVVVGWDRPLGCFFGHVYNADPEGDDVLVAEYKIPTLDGCLAFAMRHAKDVPFEDLRALLEEDMLADYPASNRTMALREGKWCDDGEDVS